jgi:chloride channel 3/4/5
VDVIDIGHPNTVRTLRDQLARLVRAGYAVTGFPILSTDEDGKSRMLGFIGGNELEHALSMFSFIWLLHLWVAHSLIWDTSLPGIVAEDADYPVSFQSEGRRFGTISSTSISSIIEDAEDRFNFSVYMDKVRRSANIRLIFYSSVVQAPLTISVNSPLELVQQFFVKLGARYVVVTDADGYCELFPFSLIDGARPHLEQFSR